MRLLDLLAARLLRLLRQQRLGPGALLAGLLDQPARLLGEPRLLLGAAHLLDLAAGAGEHLGLLGLLLLAGAALGLLGHRRPSLRLGLLLRFLPAGVLGRPLLGLRRLALGLLLLLGLGGLGILGIGLRLVAGLGLLLVLRLGRRGLLLGPRGGAGELLGHLVGGVVGGCRLGDQEAKGNERNDPARDGRCRHCFLPHVPPAGAQGARRLGANLFIICGGKRELG